MKHRYIIYKMNARYGFTKIHKNTKFKSSKSHILLYNCIIGGYEHIATIKGTLVEVLNSRLKAKNTVSRLNKVMNVMES